jgi:hypothetical protein
VKIELLKGGLPSVVISESAGNNGHSFWSIPLDFPVGSDYRIRITSTQNPDIVDESDSDISILSP